MVYQWVKSLQQRCLLCQCTISASPLFGLCKDCYQAMPAAEPCCQQCGLPTAITLKQCGECLKQPPLFDHTRCCTQFTADSQTLIHHLKKQHDLAYCRLLADWLTQQLPRCPTPVDALLPVPMHWQRALWQGNNHSLLLAKQLACNSGIPCQPDWLKKRHKTMPQRGLSAAQRRRNLKNAFTATSEVSAKHLVLVDDVMTTGSTMNELSRVLKKAGALSVTALVIARA